MPIPALSALNQLAVTQRFAAATPAMGSKTPQALQAENYKELGNELLRTHLYPQAIQAYQTALAFDPSYTDAHFNLAQTFRTLGDFPKAAYWLTQLLFINPNDHDSRVQLGEFYERLGQPMLSKALYLQILGQESHFDPARRNLHMLLIREQFQQQPQQAQALVQSTQAALVNETKNLLKSYYQQQQKPQLATLLEKTPIVFSETQSMGNSENIAEYDHANRVIRVQPKLLFSCPNVVAAYVAHEMVHAADQDSNTSVIEEQDGYRELARFWQVYKNGTVEPNLDRALKLYAQSPAALDHEVRRLYTMRDPLIAEKSPGHGQPYNTPAENATNKAQRVEQFREDQIKRWYRASMQLPIAQA